MALRLVMTSSVTTTSGRLHWRRKVPFHHKFFNPSSQPPLNHYYCYYLLQQQPQNNHRWFSSSSSTNKRIRHKQQQPQKSIRAEHDERVAAAQAKILARLQEQKQQGILHEQLEQERIDLEELRTIQHTIRHWLLKDVNFFVFTMEAMDISLLQGSNNYINSNRNLSSSHTSNNHKNSITSSNNNSNNNNDEQIIISEASKAFLNGNHPMQMILNQYRQLYLDSIPEFEERMIANDGEFLKEYNIFQKLKSTGFANPQWSKQFRQVKGYQIQQESLQCNLIKQKVELQRRQAVKIKVQEELDNLEAMEQLLSSKTTSRSHPTKDKENGNNTNIYSHAHKQVRSRRRKKEKQPQQPPPLPETVTGTTLQHDNDIVKPELPTEQEQKSSFWQRAWTTFSSLWTTTTQPVVVSTPTKIKDMDLVKNNSMDEESQRIETSQLTVNSPPTAPLQLSSSNSSRANGMQKRLIRKRLHLKQLEDDVNEVATKITHVQQQIHSLPIPLPTQEYERAQNTILQVRDILCTQFAKHMQQQHAHWMTHYETLNSKTDLTKPQEWFPYARLDQRKIIFHGGPTNSGKTYSALQRLKEAKQGLYLGPLRLLAAEIYETLTAEGLYTNLFTGQEKRQIAFSTHTSATVEMFTAEKEHDVVVLDEIQMLADPTRGAAWTKALLGLRCKEIHVCGGMEAKNIVEKMAKACGDELEVQTYQRFTELRIAEKSLSSNYHKTGAYSHVQPGDCVVAFSRNDIFAIKREIENTTHYKCCVIYGKLPPQTRADQARRFNDPDSGYDILVASDAIGMGLNLNIRRIIFNTIFKFNGDKIIRLGHSEVKQISGRAGRRNSPYPYGEVTCRDPRDLPYIKECLSTDIVPIEKAGLMPTAAHIELFSDAMSAYDVKNNERTADLHQVLKQFNAMATVRGDYFLGRQHEMSMIAKRIKDVPLTLRDAYNMCLSPTSENSLVLLESFAWKFSRGEVPGLPSRSVPKRATSFDDLSYLCGIYADSDLFLWLGLKFPPSNAVEQAAAVARKEQTLEYINEALAASESLKLNHCYLKTASRLRKVWETENGRSRDVGLNEELESDDDDDDDEDDDEDDDYYLDSNREAVY